MLWGNEWMMRLSAWPSGHRPEKIPPRNYTSRTYQWFAMPTRSSSRIYFQRLEKLKCFVSISRPCPPPAPTESCCRLIPRRVYWWTPSPHDSKLSCATELKGMPKCSRKLSPSRQAGKRKRKHIVCYTVSPSTMPKLACRRSVLLLAQPAARKCTLRLFTGRDIRYSDCVLAKTTKGLPYKGIRPVRHGQPTTEQRGSCSRLSSYTSSTCLVFRSQAAN